MAEKHDLIAQLLNKGGDVEQCLKLLKEVRESEEKVAEREERRAERELEKAKIEKEIRLKELEIKEKEVSLGTNSLAEMSKTKPKVQLPKFSEGEDIEVFLTSFEKLAISYKWVKSEWAIRLVPQLTGKALEAYSRMSSVDSNDFIKVKQAILERYGLNALAYREKFRLAKQDRTETFKEYAIRVEGYLKHWVNAEDVKDNYHKLYDLVMREQLMFTASPDLQVWLRERNPHTFLQLVEMADTYQLAHKQSSLGAQYQKESITGNSSVQNNKKFGQSMGIYQKQSIDNVRRCFYCESTEHFISNCPVKKTKEGKMYLAGNRQGNDGNPTTHTSALLLSPKKIGTNTQKVSLPLTVEQNYDEIRKLDNGLKLVKGYVNGKEAWMLRDTGCTTVCISKKFAKQINLKKQEEKWVSLANGTECLCYEVEVDIESPYISGTVTALTMDCPFADVILGESAFVKECSIDKQFKIESKMNKDKCASNKTTDRNLTGNISEMKQEDLKFTTQSVSTVETRNMRAKREEEEAQNEKVEYDFVTERNKRQNKSQETKGSLVQYNNGTNVSQNLKHEQQSDPTLTKVRELANMKEEDKEETSFFFRNGILYRKFKMQNDEILEQIVVPEMHRNHIIHVAHDIPLGGHLGNKKTREKILFHFYWPGIFPDVARFCRSCKNCQKCIPKGRVPRAPLIPIQPMEEPFNRIAMDIVGPLNKSGRGHKFILVLCDYATKYPEAVPLKTIDSETVANAMIEIFSRVGIPKEILTDQGSNFMSSLMCQLCTLLDIKKLNTTPYHPQANGLVENFNGTLKKMLKCYAQEEPTDWDRHIPYVLFAYRESPHETTGYSPFELLYGRQVRGPLQLMKENWEDDQTIEEESLVSYIIKTRDRLEKLHELASFKEMEAKRKQKKYFDGKSKVRDLEPCQRVLVLLPTSNSNLLAEWKGPYKVIEKVSPVDYKVQINRKTSKVYHINILKLYFEREQITQEREEAVQCLDIICSLGEELEEDEQVICNPLLVQTESIDDVIISDSLETEKANEIKGLIKDYADVITNVPGRTDLVSHDIKLKDMQPVLKKPYCLPFALRSQVKKEIDNMKHAGIIEPSQSPWVAPIVCVPKKDKTLRFCVDYRGLNSKTVFDPQQMPKIDDILNKLSKAKYLTKIDLTKGYWQIPLAEQAKPLSAFVTPFGQYQFQVMPFGMINSGASFVRLMKKILEGKDEFSDSFIDDIIIFSDTWLGHLHHVKSILREIRHARLTAKPSKCFFAFRQLEFLAHIVGNGEVKPTEDKVKAIQDMPVPTTKRKVRSLIGYLNFYRRFIPHFSEIASPLTDLTAKSAPNKVIWTDQHQQAFDTLKKVIITYPVLRNPDFDKMFILQTDSSDRGIGAVLLQEFNGTKLPILFISKKLLFRERQYSTIEKECLAIVRAVSQLREYLEGKQFIIESDHFPLQWLNKMRGQNQRLLRWSLLLQEFTFKLQHIRGKDNKIADVLSRAFESVE